MNCIVVYKFILWPQEGVNYVKLRLCFTQLLIRSLNTTDTIYDPDVFATTIALTVTTNDTTHYPRFRIRVVSGESFEM